MIYKILPVLAIVIVILLALWAARLQWQLRQRAQQQAEQIEQEARQAQEKTDKRYQELSSDIQFIARSMLQKQCEITEGVMRIHVLADALDTDTMLQPAFSTLHGHFLQVKQFPIMQAYKDLSRKEQFKIDRLRDKLEQENEAAILQELETLLSQRFVN